MELTAADRAILRIMQRDASTTLADLASEVGQSPSAVQRRLQRLREAKVILRDVSVLDVRQIGPSITLLVELELERDRPELLPSLHDWIRRSVAVQQAWHITGRGDYVLVIMARSIEHFDAIAETMMAANANIRKFTSSVVLKPIKTGMELPVWDPPDED